MREASFDLQEMNDMINLSAAGIYQLIAIQKEVLGTAALDIGEGKRVEGCTGNNPGKSGRFRKF